MKDSIIENKSIRYGIEIVVLYKYLVRDKKEFVLSKQLLRSGTSIGANISEAENAQSRKDFIHKIEISQKEAAENLYWLKLLYLSE